MSFICDHDYHIHSCISACSGDAEQSAENILKLAKENGFTKICVTDHFWDSAVEGASDWYKPQDFNRLSKILPLPQADGIDFHFGCETEMDMHMRLGISDELIDRFDFIIIPTTHMHMVDFTVAKADASAERRADVYVKRLDALLSKNLPFEKIGIAHLTCVDIMARREDVPKVFDLISDATLKELFTKAAKRKAGIELNFEYFNYTETEKNKLLRPYIIAKECGCKFYMGSDAHHPHQMQSIREKNFEPIAAAIGLEERDKFTPKGF